MPFSERRACILCNECIDHTIYLPYPRGTDPKNFELVGLPPKDIVSSLAVALRRAGYDYDEVFQRCIGVSNEWNYNPTSSSNVAERFSQKYIRQRSVPMTHKTLEEVLSPQPVAQKARSLHPHVQIGTSVLKVSVANLISEGSDEVTGLDRSCGRVLATRRAETTV